MVGTVDDNPKGYEVCSMSDVSKLLNGYAFKSKNYVKDGIKIIRITNVQKGYVADNDPQYYPLETESEIKDYMLFENDLLISLTGNVGRVGLLPSEMCPAALNQRVGCIRPNETLIDKIFLFATLNMDTFEKDCIASSNGSAQLNMSTEWLKKYKIVVPPLTVQKEIAAFITQSDKSKFDARMTSNLNLWSCLESIRRIVK